ncbi:MAG: hypothetical protein ACRDLD_02245 [Thermoleophilaceae bacterium]
MSDTRRPRRKRKPQGDIQASFEQGGPLSRYNERSTKRLRARHRELGNKSKFPELAEGTEDKRRKQIAAVLRNRSLRGQFGSDWRQKAYGDISGYKPGLADRIGAEKGSEAPDEEKLSSMREAFAELRKRRRSYSPGQRYDSGTGEFVPRHGRPKRRGGKDEGRQMVTRGRRRRRRGRRRVSASFEPR